MLPSASPMTIASAPHICCACTHTHTDSPLIYMTFSTNIIGRRFNIQHIHHRYNNFKIQHHIQWWQFNNILQESKLQCYLVQWRPWQQEHLIVIRPRVPTVEFSHPRDHLVQGEEANLFANGLQLIGVEGVCHHFELQIWKNKFSKEIATSKDKAINIFNNHSACQSQKNKKQQS